jgi:hypothetical protein
MPVEITIKVRNTTDKGPFEIKQTFIMEEMEYKYGPDWLYEIGEEIVRMSDQVKKDLPKYE